MSSAIARFYYDHINNKKNYNKLVSGVFNSIVFRGFAILLVAFVFRNYIGQLFTQVELQDFPKYGFAAILIGIFRGINTTPKLSFS